MFCLLQIIKKYGTLVNLNGYNTGIIYMNASSAESITSWQPVSRNSSPKNDRQLKVVIVGDGASGKVRFHVISIA